MELLSLAGAASDFPRIAKDDVALDIIEKTVREIPTSHKVVNGDARNMGLSANSVHLVLTSPPYWTLKEYRDTRGQMGHIANYEEFIGELDKVWRQCYDALTPGGRLICVVGDVCMSRRKNGGRHAVIPLHTSIQENCREIGFDNFVSYNLAQDI